MWVSEQGTWTEHTRASAEGSVITWAARHHPRLTPDWQGNLEGEIAQVNVKRGPQVNVLLSLLPAPLPPSYASSTYLCRPFSATPRSDRPHR